MQFSFVFSLMFENQIFFPPCRTMNGYNFTKTNMEVVIVPKSFEWIRLVVQRLLQEEIAKALVGCKGWDMLETIAATTPILIFSALFQIFKRPGCQTHFT